MKNQNISTGISGSSNSRVINRDIKNLSIIKKVFKKPILAKFKKLNLIKANSSETDFLIPKAKKLSYIYKKFSSKH